MKKIGITTTLYGNNYGEALQAYAMRKAINMCAIDCQAELIKFVCKRQTINKPGYNEFYEANKLKNQLFDAFRKNEIGIEGDPINKITLENTPVFDKYVFGSDQIWNTNSWEIPEFFGSFVPDGRPKIAYAASVGIKPECGLLKLELFDRYIKTFDYLSVREKVHCGFISNFTNKQVYHVVDPTLLLEVDNYIALTENVNPPKPNNGYIFYYQPNSADGAIVSLVNKIARRYKKDVVHTFADVPEPIFPSESISTAFLGPCEFLAYIRDADLIITRSYHGTIFSILFQKPFYVYVDKKTGSRVESLLGILGLEDRLIYEYKKPEDVSFAIDFSEANRKLEKLIKSSFDFLIAAIN